MSLNRNREGRTLTHILLLIEIGGVGSRKEDLRLREIEIPKMEL